MQEIINAMLKAILKDANQQKPIMFSVKRGNDLFVEFHSGYMFEFQDGYITITNMETQKKVRVRDGVNAKLSKEVLDVLKDWLNKDFNSGITIEDDTEESDDEPNQEESEGEGDEGEGNTEDESEQEESKPKAGQNKKIPGWATFKK